MTSRGHHAGTVLQVDDDEGDARNMDGLSTDTRAPDIKTDFGPPPLAGRRVSKAA